MLTEKEIINLERGEYFIKNNFIGCGAYGNVYKINEKYVVKKISTNCFFKSNDYKALLREIEATIILSAQNIAPKVVYHSKKKETFIYYVMEKLEYTLYNLLKHGLFNELHSEKLNQILNKLNNTQYRHNDLHLNNIMWSNRYNEFRIIDWGLYWKSKKRKTKSLPNKVHNRIIHRALFWMKNSAIMYKCFGFRILKVTL